ncbi:hypothetical protein MAR_012514, partial [Mya arenaria]
TRLSPIWPNTGREHVEAVAAFPAEYNGEQACLIPPTGHKCHCLLKGKHHTNVHGRGGISRRGANQVAISQGKGHRFHQDKDIDHRSHLARDFMHDNGIHWMDDWPSGRAPSSTRSWQPSFINYLEIESTVDTCYLYIYYVFKVAPGYALIPGAATSDVPKNVFLEHSAGLSFLYFKSVCGVSI